MPGTYPRPQSRAVRLILELYPETRLIHQVRAGEMAEHQEEILTRTKHGKHTRQVVRPNKQKWVTHPWPDFRRPVNSPAGNLPVGDNRLSHGIKENTSFLMTFRVSYFDPEEI